MQGKHSAESPALQLQKAPSSLEPTPEQTTISNDDN